MSLKMLTRAMHACTSTPHPAPVIMVWDDPGSGKTAAAYALAVAQKRKRHVEIVALKDPTDIGGLPYPEDGAAAHLVPKWFRKCQDGNRWMIVWDEVTSAPAANQSACMRIVQEGAIDDERLPEDKVVHIMIGNPPETAANGNDEADPLANRQLHWPFPGPTLGEWDAYMAGVPETEDLPELDLDKWKAKHDWLHARMTLYFRQKGGIQREHPSKIRGRFPFAYATHRSWTNLCRAGATALALGWDDLLLPFAVGLVGEPLATEFFMALREMDVPDPEDIVTGKVAWKPDPNRPDVTLVLTRSVAQAAVTGAEKKGKDYEARWNRAVDVLDAVAAQGKDFVALAFKILVAKKNRPKGWTANPKCAKLAAALAVVMTGDEEITA